MKDITIPLSLISILADGKFLSIKQICQQLSISKEKISKHMHVLYDWIGNMFIASKEGYRLLEPIHLLNEKIINRKIIGKKVICGKIIILPIIGSTNQYLLDHINELHSGDACVAECQRAGRGRRGRKWFSPFGTNLYFSMFWSFQKVSFSTVTGLSPVIGIVVAEILQKFGATDIRVKWPNDLYLHNRKLGGILVEITKKKIV